MTTLEELMLEKKIGDLTDLQVIKLFFEMNDLEEDAIELISDLTKSKINKMKRKLSAAKTWITILPSEYLYENYELRIADRLHNLELDFLVNGCELSKSTFEWAKENVPNIKMPKVYFQPLVKYMEENGVHFKGYDK